MAFLFHRSLSMGVPAPVHAGVGGERWEVEVDTAAPMLGDVEAQTAKTGEPVQVDARSVQVLRKVF